MLSADDLERYSRQILLPRVGARGQERLGKIRVAVVGVGGLGSPAAIYLAAAGVGHLTLIDSDAVDRSNLHRQIIHGEADLGRPKVDSGSERIRELNPSVGVERIRERLTDQNIREVLRGHDIVVEGSDNLETKFLVNDACHDVGIPHVWGGVLRFEGQISLVLPGETSCYRCLFRDLPPPGATPTCQEAGILGPVAGLIGTLQAAEVIKWGMGVGDGITDGILCVDLLTMGMRRVKVPRSGSCPLCGDPALRIDVSGTECPMTFVKVKVALESLGEGEILEVILNGDDHPGQVPPSVRQDGHEIISTIPEEDRVCIRIRKGSDAADG